MSGSSSANSQILFNTIPINQLRVPGVNIEIDPQGGTGQTPFRVLIIGQVTSAGAAPVNLPLICAGPADAVTQGGPGSMLALMAARCVTQDTFGEYWYLPLADDPASAAATLAFVFSGTCTAAGTLSLRIAGILVPVLVTSSTTGAQLAALVISTINANINLPVTAAATSMVTGGVTVTAKNKGLSGNDIDVRVNYLGTAGGETTPAGITFTGIQNQVGTQLTGGAQNPTALATALANLGKKKFSLIVQPYNDTASRTAFQTFMNNTSGRWCWNQMLYGQGIGAYRGTFSSLTTFGTSRDDPAMSTMGFNDAPEPSWIWAADIAANCAISARVNPAIPLHDIPLGVLPPPQAEVFAYGADNTLLFDGISTFKVNDSGQVFIQQLITEWQTNAAGVPDVSFLYVNTRLQLDYICTDLRNYLATTYARKILVSDQTRVSVVAGGPIVTPSLAKASVINRYRYQESQGVVQNGDAFAQTVNVQIVAPGILGVYWPGDLAAQLNNIAIQIAFTQT